MKAVYAGSFDPFTNGHEDILLQARKVFDHVSIVICTNSVKKHFLSLEERTELIKDLLNSRRLDGISISTLEEGKAIADYAISIKANALIRGIRSVTDFDYELQMASMNKRIQPNLTTVFLTPKDERNQFVSSSMVREFIRINKDISSLVPLEIFQALARKD